MSKNRRMLPPWTGCRRHLHMLIDDLADKTHLLSSFRQEWSIKKPWCPHCGGELISAPQSTTCPRQHEQESPTRPCGGVPAPATCPGVQCPARCRPSGAAPGAAPAARALKEDDTRRANPSMVLIDGLLWNNRDDVVSW